MRTIFIWDIHWCFDEFVALLEKIKYNVETDQLYLTGDLINKWPKWVELIDFLVQNPQIKSVIWNNEVNFLRYLYFLNIDDNFQYLEQKWFYDKIYNKKNNLFDSYLEKFDKKHIDYLKKLPLYIETEKWILLHWWLFSWKKLEEHHIDEITRLRQIDQRPWYEFYNGEKTIIYGHYAQDGLRIRKNTKWLDSGCVYGKHLTAYCFETGELWQVSAKKQYIKIE